MKKTVAIIIVFMMVFGGASVGAAQVQVSTVYVNAIGAAEVSLKTEEADGLTIVAVSYKNGKMIGMETAEAKAQMSMALWARSADTVKVFLVNSVEEFVPVGRAVTVSI